MTINEIISQRGLSMYKLAKASGIPYTTISDICSGKTSIENCSSITLYKLSKVLGSSMENLMEGVNTKVDYRSTFDVFKSNVCHQVKDLGDIDFLIDTLNSDRIRQYFNRGWYPESLYLLAMVDYLSRENNLPICQEYNDIRSKKLAEPLFPLGIVMASTVTKNDRWKDDSLRHAIPEFLRFNIVEGEIRNVF